MRSRRRDLGGTRGEVERDGKGEGKMGKKVAIEISKFPNKAWSDKNIIII